MSQQIGPATLTMTTAGGVRYEMKLRHFTADVSCGYNATESVKIIGDLMEGTFRQSLQMEPVDIFEVIQKPKTPQDKLIRLRALLKEEERKHTDYDYEEEE